MWLNLATLALLALWIGAAIGGVWLVRQRGVWRIVGIVLLIESILMLVMQVLLSTYPIGIGDPLIRVKFVEVIKQAGLTLLVVSLIGLMLYTFWRTIHYAIDQQQKRRLLVGLLMVALPIIAVPSFVTMWKTSIPPRERERDPNKRDISLPDGFKWSVYATGTMDNPTTITFAPDGTLFIADIAGDLWLAKDTNSDNTIDSITKWAGDFDLLVGLAWRDGELFCASSGKIEALRDSDGDGTADQRRMVVDNLPSMILKPHSNNGLAFGPDGRLYFGVGSTTDGKYEEAPLAASILSVKPDGTDLKPYARGLGYTFDVAFNSSGDLFGGDNAPSNQGGENAPDEFNYFKEGEHYGYPYYYGDPPKNGGTKGALISFPPHSVPTGVTFYSGDQYPPAYRDSAFITLWQTGEIAHIEVGKTATGDYLARNIPFASGFLYPIDVINGPDGNLYVADFGTSAIYRITFSGER